MIVPSCILLPQPFSPGDMQSHDPGSLHPWHPADGSCSVGFLLSKTLDILAVWDCDRLVQRWQAKVQKMRSVFRLYPLVAFAHRCIHGCSPRQRARCRAFDIAINNWVQHRHGGAWVIASAERSVAQDDLDRLLVDGGHFAFDSQEWRPPWPPACQWYRWAWHVRFYALQGRLCSLLRVHGHSLLRELDQADDPLCCDEYSHTLGSNCWRAFAQVRIPHTGPPFLACPVRLHSRCCGAHLVTESRGGWDGYSSPRWVERRSPTGPAIVPVPQWWRRDVPL